MKIVSLIALSVIALSACSETITTEILTDDGILDHVAVVVPEPPVVEPEPPVVVVPEPPVVVIVDVKLQNTKCNAGRGNTGESVGGVSGDCDPGKSGGKNKGKG